ncbi:MAG: hypothetical protein AB1611_06325 [bacterium]
MRKKLSFLLCAAIMLSEVFIYGKTAQAAWVDISGQVTVTTTRQSYDRLNHVFFSYVKITNNSGAAITWPARFLITSTSIPVSATPSGPDGYEGGTPYFYFLGNGETLSPHASKTVRVNFQS